jgi:hypothetical protein
MKELDMEVCKMKIKELINWRDPNISTRTWEELD